MCKRKVSYNIRPLNVVWIWIEDWQKPRILLLNESCSLSIVLRRERHTSRILVGPQLLRDVRKEKSNKKLIVPCSDSLDASLDYTQQQNGKQMSHREIGSVPCKLSDLPLLWYVIILPCLMYDLGDGVGPPTAIPMGFNCSECNRVP